MFLEPVAGEFRLVSCLIGALATNFIIWNLMHSGLYLGVFRLFLQSDLFLVEVSESLIVHNSFFVAYFEPLLGMELECQTKTFCSINLLSGLGMFFHNLPTMSRSALISATAFDAELFVLLLVLLPEYFVLVP